MIPEHWFEADLAVLDVETTGFDPLKDRVIEVGIVHMRGGEVLDSWGQLVNPGRLIPPDVVQLTGIQQEQVDSAPPFADVAAEVAERLAGRVLVAYNLSFDRGFVSAELARAGRTWPTAPELDPLVFARQLQAAAGSKRLGAVAERLGIRLEEAHRAVDDATTAGRVLYAFRTQLPERLNELVELQAQWARQQEQQLAARRRMRGAVDADDDLSPAFEAVRAGGTIALGPAYIYGQEPDPLRFFYGQLPDVTVRR